MLLCLHRIKPFTSITKPTLVISFLSFLSEFAAFEPVEGFEEGALLMCFADLRQLLDLFMTEDWSTYFHDYGSENSKYLRVSPHNAIIVVEK